MVYTLIDHRNDVIKFSKLKCNHEPQAGEWFHCKVLNVLFLWSISCLLYTSDAADE